MTSGAELYVICFGVSVYDLYDSRFLRKETSAFRTSSCLALLDVCYIEKRY